MEVTSEPISADHRARPRILRSQISLVLSATSLAVCLLVIGILESSHRTLFEAVLLGFVEGVTEFLPISSTGHLVVAQRLLGIGETASEKAAADSFAIVIQAGAIAAVLLLYRRRVSDVIRSFFSDDATNRRVGMCLLVAAAPAGLVGVLFGDAVKTNLLAPGPIALAWAVGGLAILLLAGRLSKGSSALEETSLRSAMVIGVAQVLALWPGVSRSLVTILAATAVGMAPAAAVEFSFLLGLVTLGAATGWEALDGWSNMVSHFGVSAVVAGFVSAAISAALAVKWMVAYLQRRSLAIFGWYRLAAATGVALLALSGVF